MTHSRNDIIFRTHTKNGKPYGTTFTVHNKTISQHSGVNKPSAVEISNTYCKKVIQSHVTANIGVNLRLLFNNVNTGGICR